MKQNTQNQIIFFFPNPQVGGVEKNFQMISNFLPKHFKNLYLISSNKIKFKINNQIKLINVNSFWLNINKRIFFVICALKLLIISLKFKNSLIFSFQGNFYAIIVAIILKRKIIVRSNLSPDGWKCSFLKEKIFKYLLSKANFVIVNSLDFKKQMQNKFKIKCTKIPNPINCLQVKKISNCKKKINFFKNNTTNLINVGRLVPQKNQVEILHALVKLKNLLNNYRLLIIGDGPEKNNLKNFINSEKLGKYVKIISSKSPYKYIKMADVFILSSKHEGLPNVLLESACLNKYIISSNCKSGPREILKDYKFGILYEQGNSKDLYSKIKKINITKIKLNKKNYSLNLSKFDMKKNLNKYYDIIKKLL